MRPEARSEGSGTGTQPTGAPATAQADSAAARRAGQLRYANMLDLGAKISFAVLAAAFMAYVTGLLSAHVAREELPQLWVLPLDAYLSRTGAPTRWDWIGLLAKGEYASIAGIALLAACSLPCLVAIVPQLWRSGDRALAVIAGLIALVLLLAASGLLIAGH
jgi:hypothetical protein